MAETRSSGFHLCLQIVRKQRLALTDGDPGAGLLKGKRNADYIKKIEPISAAFVVGV